MSADQLRACLVALSCRDRRADALRELAAHVGVSAIHLLVRDPGVGAFLPAPGLQQTLRGGRSWREFLRNAPKGGRWEGEVELPRGQQRRANGLSVGETLLILLDGDPPDALLKELESYLPLLDALFCAEVETVLAQAEAVAAQQSRQRTEELAHALEGARADASALNALLRFEQRRKDEFLAMLSHELRNPLAPLVTTVHLLRMKGVGAPLSADILDVVERQVKQLTRLVNDLLEMSRINRGRIDLQLERLLITDPLQAALEESRPLIDASAHHVAIQPPEEPLLINGDCARLTQTFANLLTNAAKYTDPGGRIEVSIRRDGPNAVVCVRDTGIGISSEMLPHIFDLFAQAPEVLSRAQGGLGIGLTLVRTLVELHGGRISVESPGLGQGRTFTISLPLVTADLTVGA